MLLNFFILKCKSGQIETASTNHLMEMWNRDFNYVEFLIGSGRYSYENGAYYMHVDPGIYDIHFLWVLEDICVYCSIN